MKIKNILWKQNYNNFLCFENKIDKPKSYFRKKIPKLRKNALQKILKN